ncbi:MAG: hypothetical protein QOJ00_2685, partial [Actinomycetota bacterium]
TTISRWEAGVTSLDLRQLVAVERALGLAPGEFFAATGLVPAKFRPRDLASMLGVAPEIPVELREAMVSLYQAAQGVASRAAPVDVEAAILADGDLDPHDADSLIGLYRRLRRDARFRTDLRKARGKVVRLDEPDSTEASR